MDITYIPMAHGFVYLAVVLDWFSRRVLSWRLSITMEAAFLRRGAGGGFGSSHGKPEIFNTDQGAASSPARAFTGVLDQERHRDQHGRQGRWRDNVFVERLWRTVKYEEVYLKAYDSVTEARSLDRPVSRLL